MAWVGKRNKKYLHKSQNEDCNITQIGKIKYREYVSQACHVLNEERLRSQASDIKCARIATERYGKKEYIQQTNISNTRDQFSARFGLTAFAGNYTHNKKYAKSDWLCRCQQSSESESHLMSGGCKVFGDLADNFGDLNEDSNLVSFFRAVLDRRDHLEEEERFGEDIQGVNDTLGASSTLGIPGIRTRRLEESIFPAE